MSREVGEKDTLSGPLLVSEPVRREGRTTAVASSTLHHLRVDPVSEFGVPHPESVFVESQGRFDDTYMGKVSASSFLSSVSEGPLDVILLPVLGSLRRD